MWIARLNSARRQHVIRGWLLHLTEIILQIQVIKLKTFSCNKLIEQVQKSLFRKVRSIKFYRACIATSKYYNNNKCMEYPKKCIALSGYSTASYVISLSLLLDCSPTLVLSKQKTYEFRKPVANQIVTFSYRIAKACLITLFFFCDE